MKTFSLTIGKASISRTKEDEIFDALIDDWCYDHNYAGYVAQLEELGEIPLDKENFMLRELVKKIKKDVYCGRKKRYEDNADINSDIDL